MAAKKKRAKFCIRGKTKKIVSCHFTKSAANKKLAALRKKGRTGLRLVDAPSKSMKSRPKAQSKSKSKSRSTRSSSGSSKTYYCLTWGGESFCYDNRADAEKARKWGAANPRASGGTTAVVARQYSRVPSNLVTWRD